MAHLTGLAWLFFTSHILTFHPPPSLLFYCFISIFSSPNREYAVVPPVAFIGESVAPGYNMRKSGIFSWLSLFRLSMNSLFLISYFNFPLSHLSYIILHFSNCLTPPPPPSFSVSTTRIGRIGKGGRRCGQSKGLQTPKLAGFWSFQRIRITHHLLEKKMSCNRWYDCPTHYWSALLLPHSTYYYCPFLESKNVSCHIIIII